MCGANDVVDTVLNIVHIVLAELVAAGVRTYPNSTATGWQDGALQLRRSDTGERLIDIHAETLVTVTIREPETTLSEALSAQGTAHRVIGDAEVPGTIQSAIYSGHRHAREILGTEPENRIFKRERPTLFL